MNCTMMKMGSKFILCSQGQTTSGFLTMEERFVLHIPCFWCGKIFMDKSKSWACLRKSKMYCTRYVKEIFFRVLAYVSMFHKAHGCYVWERSGLSMLACFTRHMAVMCGRDEAYLKFLKVSIAQLSHDCMCCCQSCVNVQYPCHISWKSANIYCISILLSTCFIYLEIYPWKWELRPLFNFVIVNVTGGHVMHALHVLLILQFSYGMIIGGQRITKN